MEEQIIQLKNTLAGELEIPDIGLVLEPNENIRVSKQFEYGELCSSDDLKVLITAGTIVANDGVADLSIADAIDYLTRENVKDIKEKYYSKTQMQTSGDANVHWDNITNKPSFGTPAPQLRPVEYRIVSFDSTEPAVGNNGDVYVNTTLGQYFKVILGAQVLAGAVEENDRVIDLSTNLDSIYGFDGTTQNIADVPILNNSGIVVEDDGDGGQSQYVYNGDTTTGTWGKIGDIDFGPHLNGGPDKHKTTEIAVITALNNLGILIGDTVDDVFTAINNAIGSIRNDITSITTDIDNLEIRITNVENTIIDLSTDVTNNTIDITNLQIAITNEYNDRTDADIYLQNQITDLSGGSFTNFKIENGVYYILDSVRNKQIGPKHDISFGKRSSAKNKYLRTIDSIPSNLTGERIPKDWILLGATAQISSTGTCILHIRKNNATTDDATVVITNGIGVTIDDFNIKFTADDRIYTKCTCPAGDVYDVKLKLFFGEWGGDGL